MERGVSASAPVAAKNTSQTEVRMKRLGWLFIKLGWLIVLYVAVDNL